MNKLEGAFICIAFVGKKVFYFFRGFCSSLSSSSLSLFSLSFAVIYCPAYYLLPDRLIGSLQAAS